MGNKLEERMSTTFLYWWMRTDTATHLEKVLCVDGRKEQMESTKFRRSLGGKRRKTGNR